MRGGDPDLENARRPRFAIILGVPDARARAHHLYVARLGPALVAEAPSEPQPALKPAS